MARHASDSYELDSLSPLTLRGHKAGSSTVQYPPPTPRKFSNFLRSRHRDASWTPLLLRPLILASFLGVYFIIGIVLIALWAESNAHQGFVVPLINLGYLWTYAPTTVFTVIAALWTQVEYRAKFLRPWQSLSEGPASAEKTILLDYTSPWNLVVLFRSIKARHVSVALIILSSVVLKVAIILSTGLFVLQDVSVVNRATVLVAQSNLGAGNVPFNTSTVDIRPAEVLIGASTYKVPLPPGTSPDFAYQLFETPEGYPSVSSIEANVEAFASYLECEEASLQFDTSNFDPTIVTPNITFTNLMSPTLCPSAWVGRYIFNGSTGIFQLLNCSGVPNDATALGFGLAFGTFNGTDPPVPNVGAIVCRPVAQTMELSVTLNPNARSSFESASVLSTNQLTNETMLEVLYHSYTTCLGLISSYWLPDSDLPVVYWDPTFALMNLFVLPPEPTAFSNLKYLTQSFNATWSAFAAQIANLYFRQSDARTIIPGTSVFNEQRLQVHRLSLILIGACLLVLILCSLGVLIQSPGPRLPYSPTSVYGLAKLLHQSPIFLSVMSGTGAVDLHSIRHELKPYLFSTSWNADSELEHPFQLEPTQLNFEPYEHERNAIASQQDPDWYTPMGFSKRIKVVVPLLLATLIVILEVLLRYSHRNQGLLDTENPNSDYYLHYAWHYPPAIVMVLISILVGMLHSAALVLRGFIPLQRGGTAANTIFRSSFDMISFFGNRKAFGKSYVGLVTAVIAVTAASLLTIVVSNLYTTEDYSRNVDVNVTQTGWFQRYDEYLGLTLDVNYGLPVNMVLSGNLTWPQWTFSDFALPEIALPDLSLNSSERGTLSMRLPALRGEFNCSRIDTHVIALNASKLDSSTSNSTDYVYLADIFEPELSAPIVQQVLWEAQDPNGCLKRWVETSPLQSYTDTPLDSWYLKFPAPETGYFGGLWPWPSVGNDTFYDECGLLLAWFGEVSPNAVEDLSVMLCSPYITSLNVDVTFSMPGYVVEDAVAAESVVTVLVHGGDLWGYGDAVDGANGWLTNVDLAFVSGALVPKTADVLDLFFTSLIYGSYGIPGAELSGPENRSTLLAALNHQFRVVCAQIYGLAYRGPAPSGTAAIAGQLNILGPTRLMQDSVSTQILEALLGLILVCVLATYLTVDTRKVLPKNPASIAAMASIVADAEFMNNIAIKTDALSVDQPNSGRSRAFDDAVFFLRWWPKSETQGRRFGIDAEDGQRSGALLEDEDADQQPGQTNYESSVHSMSSAISRFRRHPFAWE